MKQPLPSDYNLTESKIKQIRSLLRVNKDLKGRYTVYICIVACIVIAIILWPLCEYASLVIAPFIVFCFFGWLIELLIDSPIDKYLKKRELKIEGASSIVEYEFQLAKYNKFKEEERIKEKKQRAEKERIKASEELERKRKSWDYWIGLSPFDFEKEIAELYKRNGYDAKVTPATGDGGIDIILSREGKETLVQCKRHSAKVGPAPVRELYGVMSARGVKEGCLICPAGFTSGAFDFAKKHGIRLVGLKRILELVEGQRNEKP